MDHLVPCYNNVQWIYLFWEFLILDPYDGVGYLDTSLYGKKFLHLKPKGKQIMYDAIRVFQK